MASLTFKPIWSITPFKASNTLYLAGWSLDFLANVRGIEHLHDRVYQQYERVERYVFCSICVGAYALSWLFYVTSNVFDRCLWGNKTNISFRWVIWANSNVTRFHLVFIKRSRTRVSSLVIVKVGLKIPIHLAGDAVSRCWCCECYRRTSHWRLLCYEKLPTLFIYHATLCIWLNVDSLKLFYCTSFFGRRWRRHHDRKG